MNSNLQLVKWILMKENVCEGEHLKLWLEKDILFGVYKPTVVDLETAKAAAMERLCFCNGISYLSLVDYSNVKVTTREARDYFVTEEASRHITAMAVIINSLVGKIILNFFISFNKPTYPIRGFQDWDSAIEWLKQFK